MSNKIKNIVEEGIKRTKIKNLNVGDFFTYGGAVFRLTDILSKSSINLILSVNMSSGIGFYINLEAEVNKLRCLNPELHYIIDNS